MDNDLKNSQIDSQQQDQTQFNSNETVTVSNETVEQANYNKTSGKKGISSGLIIGIVALLVVMAGGLFIFSNLNNPTAIYKNLVKQSVNEIYDAVLKNDGNVDATINLGFNVSLEDQMIDQNIIDLINNTKIGFNYQIDKNNEQLVFKIDSDYDKDNLLDLQMFVDGKNEKAYLYAKDYLDKYLEIDATEISNSFGDLFGDNGLTFGQKVNSKKAKNIFTEELANNLIKKDDCSKENGEYIFKISAKELVNRINITMTNLKNNEEFLNCFEDKEEIKKILDDAIENNDSSIADDGIMKISLEKKLLSKEITKAKINTEAGEMVLENENDKINYKFNTEDETILSGYIKSNKEKNTEKAELFIEIPETGKFTLNIESTVKKLDNIEKVDSAKIKKINEITEEEIMEIMTKLQESKIYEFITMFAGNI